MKLFVRYLRNRLSVIAFFLGVTALLVFSFFLYGLPLRAVLYPMGLGALLGLLFLYLDYRKTAEAHRRLSALTAEIPDLIGAMPEVPGILAEDYRHIIHLLVQQQARLSGEALQKYNAMTDYYTVWVHQIKTPIASMRLNLQNEDSDLSRRLRNDLSRIERYVEMVLAFVRLGADSTDYVIREYALDPLIKAAVKKFSSEFIGKHLSLDYREVSRNVLTDEKWLSFVLEQLLSNALKYTEHGCIYVYFEEPDLLCIRDTGIGIAPEDLPRIFENGYTGFNGRTDKRASGIGLYLCKRICDRLGHSIAVRSEVGVGTTVSVGFGTRKIEIE